MKYILSLKITYIKGDAYRKCTKEIPIDRGMAEEILINSKANTSVDGDWFKCCAGAGRDPQGRLSIELYPAENKAVINMSALKGSFSDKTRLSELRKAGWAIAEEVHCTE